MMKLFLFFLAFPFVVFASPSPKIQRRQVMNQFTLEQMWDASTAVMAAVDDPHPAAGAHCGITMQQGMELGRPLQEMIDQKRKQWIADHRPSRMRAVGSSEWKSTCQKQCRCGLYSSIFEAIGYENLAREDQLMSKMVDAYAMNQTQDTELACAQETTPSFCSSLLLNYLRQEAPNFAP